MRNGDRATSFWSRSKTERSLGRRTFSPKRTTFFFRNFENRKRAVTTTFTISSLKPKRARVSSSMAPRRSGSTRLPPPIRKARTKAKFGTDTSKQSGTFRRENSPRKKRRRSSPAFASTKKTESLFQAHRGYDLVDLVLQIRIGR